MVPTISSRKDGNCTQIKKPTKRQLYNSEEAESNKKIEIGNIPLVKDVTTMVHLLKTMGSNIKFESKKKKITQKKKFKNLKLTSSPV